MFDQRHTFPTILNHDFQASASHSACFFFKKKKLNTNTFLRSIINLETMNVIFKAVRQALGFFCSGQIQTFKTELLKSSVHSFSKKKNSKRNSSSLYPYLQSSVVGGQRVDLPTFLILLENYGFIK